MVTWGPLICHGNEFEWLVWHNKQQREGARSIRSKGREGSRTGSCCSSTTAVGTKLLLHRIPQRVKDEPWAELCELGKAKVLELSEATASSARHCCEGCAAGHGPCAGHGANPGSTVQLGADQALCSTKLGCGIALVLPAMDSP